MALPRLAAAANTPSVTVGCYRDSGQCFLRPNYFLEAIALLAIATAFFLWAAPWRALEYGSGEGIEFSKMLLLVKHPGLAHLAWDDQQWFWSQLFAQIFAVAGFHCGIPRLSTFVIVCGMLLGFRRLMPFGTGWLHLLCGWVFFWCWSNVPSLSISAMPVMPAFGVAMIAAALIPRNQAEWQWWRFCSAGILLAVAIQIKLTAFVVFPALAVKMAYIWWTEIRGQCSEQSSNHLWLNPTFGAGAFGIVLALGLWRSPFWNWALLWRNHLSAATPQAATYQFNLSLLLESPGTILATLLSLTVLWKQRRFGEAIFPMCLLGTAFPIYLYHYPWSSYYRVHFGVPLAILGGWGAGELLRRSQIRVVPPTGTNGRSFSRNTSMMWGYLAIALWTGFELPRGYAETWNVKGIQRIAENEEITVLREYEPQTKWAFTRDNILAAQAGYVLPPELTVLTKDRLWAGEDTEKYVLDTVKRYQCEVLILLPGIELKNKTWNQYLEKNYVVIWSSDRESIFVAKRLHPHPSPSRKELMKHLGIYQEQAPKPVFLGNQKPF